MTKYSISVPRWLTLESTVQFACELADLPEVDEYVFDFGSVGRIEPFAMLFLSSELQRCASKYSSAKFLASNVESCGYAAHMGFFKAFGLDHGKSPGEAKGSSTYIPITILNKEKLYKLAGELSKGINEYVEYQATEMARILTRSNSGM